MLNDKAGPPRLAITGFAGTGKTSLCEALGERLGVPVLGEDMAAIAAANQECQRVMRFRWSSEEERRAAREASVDAYVAWAGKRDGLYRESAGFVADRWELDLVNWWLVHFGLGENAVDHVTSRLMQDMRDKAKRLDAMVLMPFQSPFAVSGSHNHDMLVRKIDFTTHALFRTVAVGLLREFVSLKVIALPGQPMTVAERADFVLDELAKVRAGAPAG